MLAKKSERYIKISTSRNIYKFNFIDNIFNFYKNNKLLSVKYKKLSQMELIKIIL